MKVLIAGKGGQLAHCLEDCKPKHYDIYSFGRTELDISCKAQVETLLTDLRPNLVINAAAYTAVDKAETDKEHAFAVNASGAAHLAQSCHAIGAKLVQVSTDFVFDGKRSSPYPCDAACNPLSVYGQSKLEGELVVRDTLDSTQSLIVRTAWVYSKYGNNFVKSMLNLMRNKDQLGIVYDQVGTPTWAMGLAQWIWTAAHKDDAHGTHHWTDAGVASWYDFAVAIQELALQHGVLHKEIPIRPIQAKEYPLPAKRPTYSVIDKSSAEAVSGTLTRHWRQQLSDMIRGMAKDAT